MILIASQLSPIFVGDATFLQENANKPKEQFLCCTFFYFKIAIIMKQANTPMKSPRGTGPQ